MFWLNLVENTCCVGMHFLYASLVKVVTPIPCFSMLTVLKASPLRRIGATW